jgi:hypothetical protein
MAQSSQSPSVLRTIRIPKQLDILLRNDAKEKRLTFNSLVTGILNNYNEWEKPAEKFGIVCLTRDTFRSILEESVDEERIQKVATDLGSRIPKDVMLFWFRKANLETLLDYFTLLSQHAHFGDFQIENVDKSYTITVHHELGHKWSTYLRNFLVQGIKIITSVNPESELSKSSVVVRFEIP